MNFTTEPIFADRGQLVCRRVHWVDIVRFLAFNYGLHAVTVLSTPGEGVGSWVINRFFALFIPLVGTFKAVEVIYRCATAQPTSLEVALRAGALCMVDKSSGISETDKNFHLINLKVTTVHGQHPVPYRSLVAPIKDLVTRVKNYIFPPPPSIPVPVSSIPAPVSSIPVPAPVSGSLVIVPANYTVRPLLADVHPEFEIAYNYSFLKILAAIAQILYACYQLYATSQLQIVKFGYAAYELTIIPYAIMSLINLLAALCQPEFPTMFLVRRDSTDGEQQISAEVGIVAPCTIDDSLHKIRCRKNPKTEWALLAFCVLIFTGSIIGPYFIIYGLTGFKLGKNPGTVGFEQGLKDSVSTSSPNKKPQIFNQWVVIWIAYSQLATIALIRMASRVEGVHSPLTTPASILTRAYPPRLMVMYLFVGVVISLYGFYSIITLMVGDMICVVL